MMNQIMAELRNDAPIVHTIEETQKHQRCLLRHKYKTQVIYTLYKSGRPTSKYFL